MRKINPLTSQRPCTTFIRTKSWKSCSLMISYYHCQSSWCPALVTFPALSQIKPHDPLLVVILPSILLNFSFATIHSTKTAVDFSHSASLVEASYIITNIDSMNMIFISNLISLGYPKSMWQKNHQWYPEMSSFMVKTTAASNGLWYSNFRSWLKGM